MDKTFKLKVNILYILIQILFLACFCALYTYATVFLMSLGFSLSLVGILLSISNILGLVVQPMAADFVDKHPEIPIQKTITVVCLAGGIVSLFLYFFHDSAILTTILYFAVSLSAGVLGPLVSSLAFIFEKDGVEINYGLARAAGSGSYALATLLMGLFIDKVGMKLMFIVYAVLSVLLCIAVAFFKVKGNNEREVKQEEVPPSSSLSFGEFILRYQNFVLFIVGCSLVLFAHASVDTYFITIISEFGGSTEELGKALSLAAAVEVPGMMIYEWLSKKFSISKVMIFSLISFIVKYIVTLMARSMVMIFVAESLQMFAYALFTPGTVFVGKLCVEEQDMVKGQTLVNMTTSIATILASIVGGFALEVIAIRPYIVIVTIVSALGSLLMIYTMKKDKAKLEVHQEK